MDDSYTFFALKKDFALAYMIADQGYDVWVSNVRGNIFSKDHVNESYKAEDPLSEFWNFSFEQMAEIDLPTIINYVKEKTGVEKVDYIGHSQGTTIFFVKYMIDPEYIEQNVNKFIALGTVPNVSHAESILIKLLEDSEIFYDFPIKSMLYFSDPIRKIISKICKYTSKLCGGIVDLIVGTEPTKRIDYKKYVSGLLLYEPGGSSHKNLVHWLQCAKAKKMQRYDYGAEENMKKYGTEYPPAFDLNKIKKWNVKSIICIGDSDPFSAIEDVEGFVSLIENKSIYEVLKLEKYNHLDYLWSEDSKTLIYEKIIKFLA